MRMLVRLNMIVMKVRIGYEESEKVQYNVAKSPEMCDQIYENTEISSAVNDQIYENADVVSDNNNEKSLSVIIGNVDRTLPFNQNERNPKIQLSLATSSLD